jgi:hypothetical protein
VSQGTAIFCSAASPSSRIGSQQAAPIDPDNRLGHTAAT